MRGLNIAAISDKKELGPLLALTPIILNFARVGVGSRESKGESCPTSKLCSRLAWSLRPNSFSDPWGISHISSVSAGPWVKG